MWRLSKHNDSESHDNDLADHYSKIAGLTKIGCTHTNQKGKAMDRFKKVNMN